MAADGQALAPPPPPVDPAKAAAEAQAEAIRVAQIEALKQMNIIRRWSYRISTHEDFEMIVFTVIFANIVTLAMYNPLESDDHGHNFILDRIRKPGFLSMQPSLCGTASCSMLHNGMLVALYLVSQQPSFTRRMV